MRVLFSSATIAIISLFLFTPFAPSVFAEKVKIYEAGTSNLNVRSSPSHDAPIIGKLQIGDQVRVFQKSFGWVQTYYGGKKAWVASQYLFQPDSKTKAIAQVASSTQKSIKKEQNKKTETISRNNFDNNKGQATKNGSLKGYNIVIDPGHGGGEILVQLVLMAF
ncbi:SH3 domain-containing protein [Virgibacillus salexigens]|uniref:SH3b domain-containing protein n=1 Tax=Virgibacillus kapii TaxID=1638645 RepID=A0ABQ2DWW1_9BACI|nr:SH3 domain-containing protein [Virgibacillus kapii]GGJ76200.1 hypothetical protein GCM10007111_42220 [Virgibacillus kapii]